MIRVACALVLLALVIILAMLFDTTGMTAIAFSFVGAPALGAGISLYLLSLVIRRNAGRRA